MKILKWRSYDQMWIKVSTKKSCPSCEHEETDADCGHETCPIIFTEIHVIIFVLGTQCPGRTGGWLQMNWLSLRNNWLKLKDSGDLRIHFRGIYRIYLNLLKRNRKMSTCNRLDLETLGS